MREYRLSRVPLLNPDWIGEMCLWVQWASRGEAVTKKQNCEAHDNINQILGLLIVILIRMIIISIIIIIIMMIMITITIIKKQNCQAASR